MQVMAFAGFDAREVTRPGGQIAMVLAYLLRAFPAGGERPGSAWFGSVGDS